MSQPMAHRHRQTDRQRDSLIDAVAHHRVSAGKGRRAPQSLGLLRNPRPNGALTGSPLQGNHMAWHARVGPSLTLPHQIVGLDPSL